MATLKGFLALLQYGRYLAKLQLDSATHEFKDLATVDVGASIFSEPELECISDVDEDL